MSEEKKEWEQQAPLEPEAEPAAQQPAPEAPAPEACEAQAEQEPPASQPEEGAPEEPAAKTKKKDWFGKKEKDLEAIKAKLTAAQALADQTKEQLLRTAAEYENYRKRTARESDQKFNDGVSHAINQILPILDTLEMAANAPCADENYKKGVTMTLDKAAKALEALHVTEMQCLGKPFDPNTMNAVSQAPVPEGMQSGDVVTVYQKGYQMGDRVVRHATVVVAQ